MNHANYWELVKYDTIRWFFHGTQKKPPNRQFLIAPNCIFLRVVDKEKTHWNDCISAGFIIFRFLKVVPPGIEPGTQGFSVLCSTNWATEAKWRPGWDSNPRPPPWQGGILTNWTTGPLVGLHKTSTKIKNGGRWRDRTADILLVRQTLSQLS